MTRPALIAAMLVASTVAASAQWRTTTHPSTLFAAVDCNKLEPDYKPDDLKGPMKFYYADHPCTGNAVSWPYIAVGTITETTPAVFADFAKKNQPDTPIEFTSPGGNLLAALKLGELIRNAGYDTSLGEVCASACAYAIMGGVKRYLAQKTFDLDSDYDNRFIGASGTKLGIHQFYRSDALTEPQKKAFSAIDKSTDQMLMGILLEYTLRMGINTRLVSTASGIPPWEDIRWLTQEEMVNWNLDNTQRRYTDLTLRAFGRSGSYVETSNIRGPDTSYLRLFCQNNIKEPLVTFITDYDGRISSSGQISSTEMLNKDAVDRMKRLLGSMELNFDFGSGKLVRASFQIHELQGVTRDKQIIRVFSALRPKSVARQDLETVAKISLTDNGDLARSDWTFLDIAKFKIQGDRRLIRLAMKNCVE